MMIKRDIIVLFGQFGIWRGYGYNFVIEEGVIVDVVGVQARLERLFLGLLFRVGDMWVEV